MKEIRYIDMPASNFSAIFCKDYDIKFAGTILYSMPASDYDNTYRLLADQHDIQFIFDSNIPEVNFYAVPAIEIFAVDSNHGYWGKILNAGKNDMEAEICYICNHHEVFIVADNFHDFIFPMETIEERKNQMMKKTEEVVLYASKKEAEKVLNFL